MAWKFVEFGYNFYFQEQSQDGVTRDRLHKTLELLRNTKDFSHLDGIYSCPVHAGRHVIKIKDTRKLLFFKAYDANHEEEELRNCIELIAIIDPDNLL